MPGFVSSFTSFIRLEMIMMVMVRMTMMIEMNLQMTVTFIRLEFMEKSEAVMFEGSGLKAWRGVP